MIDTHSHIYVEEFDEDRAEAVARARDAGVERILLPNINATSVEAMLRLCSQYPGYLYPMLGLHPTDLTPDFRQVLDAMEERLREKNHPFVAVGEVGLDYYWDKTYYHQQQEAFRKQIEWAIDYQLPLMIHSRAAHHELVNIMNDYRAEGLTGVFHCFGGNAEEAHELLSFDGFALGIGGVVTYKKSTLPEVLRQIPMDRIVLETDSPYLAPVPYRGRRNESAFLPEILHCLAKTYEMEEKELEKCTNDTAERIFMRIKQA